MYLLIAGNKDASLDWSVICQSASDYMDDIEYKAKEFLHCDFCYAIDGDNGKIERDFKLPTWDNRATANVKEATKLIARRLADITPGNTNMDAYAEIEKYAKEKGIPFSAEVHCNFLRNFNEDNPNWDSSSNNC